MDPVQKIPSYVALIDDLGIHFCFLRIANFRAPVMTAVALEAVVASSAAGLPVAAPAALLPSAVSSPRASNPARGP